MRAVYIVAASTLAWPAAQLAVFWLRFDRLPPGGPVEALVFAPMGCVAGVAAAVLIARSSTERQRRSVAWGYLAASPFAMVGAILGGLVLPGVWGPLLVGGALLGAGCLIGFLAGRSGGGPKQEAAT